MQSIVATKHLTKLFRDNKKTLVKAVQDLTFSIAPGEIVALLGPNGAGKSTTIDMMLGLSKPTKGHISVCGTTPHRAIKDMKMSAMLQNGGLLHDITVRETMQLIAAQYPTHPSVAEVMDRVGLTAIASRRVSRCSGGEQQRIKFGLALLADPQLLVFDEPTTGMDVNARHEFWKAMKTHSQRTVIFATHYLEEAQNFADRVIVMNSGTIIADGTPDDMRSITGIRTITYRTRSHPDKKWLENSPHVLSVAIHQNVITVQTTDSDALLLPILESGGYNLEVVAPSLDAAFMTLTKEN